MSSFAPLPRIYLTWDVSSVPVSSFLRYEVFRRVAGSGEGWSKRARITDRSMAYWSDELCASGVTYEYTVTQVIDVAGEEVESEPASPVSAMVVIEDLFIHEVRNPSNYVQIHVPAQSVRVVQPAEMVQAWSRQAPTVHIGNAEWSEVTVSLTGVWDADIPGVSRVQWQALTELVRAQRLRGAVLMARQGRNIALYGRIDGIDRADAPLTMAERISFRETHYRDEVD